LGDERYGPLKLVLAAVTKVPSGLVALIALFHPPLLAGSTPKHLRIIKSSQGFNSTPFEEELI
jgi:hypothetical protein